MLPEPTSPSWAILAPLATPDTWGFPELEGSKGSVAAESPDPVELAHDRGYVAGYNAGLAQARTELLPTEEALRRIVDHFNREIALVRPRAEANLFALSIAIARWLFQREVTADPAAVGPLIRRAVQLLPAGASVEVHASPADVEALTAHLALVEADGRPLPVHWVADPALEAGSFRLVSPERIVDGRVDVALRALYERLAVD